MARPVTLIVGKGDADLVIGQALVQAKGEAARQKRAFDPALGSSFEACEPAWRAMREDLAQYVPYVIGHEPARHHRYWIDLIHKLLDGRLTVQGRVRRKLLLLAPPNSAKSSYCSLALPSWYLGRHPDHALMFFTSSDPMANQFGGAIKLTLWESQKHRFVFPDRVARPNPKRGWSGDGLYLHGVPTGSKDPSYRAMGWGASVVGGRANLIILDDVLDQEDSQSEIEQRKAKRYYDMTVETRLHPEGVVLAVMTRWHQNDLAAHFLERAGEDGDWVAVTLPMIAPDRKEDGPPDPIGRAPGELLWPERFGREDVERERRKGTATFNMVYQLDPTGLGGDLFKDEAWFRPLPADFTVRPQNGPSTRDRLFIFQAWDTNFSEKTTADYTVCMTFGLDTNTLDLYVLDVFRKQMTDVQIEEEMVRQVWTWKPKLVAVEDAAFRTAIIRQILTNVRQRVICNLQKITPYGDKPTRARLPAEHAERGKLYVDRRAPWYPAFASECLGFPNTTFDDHVDALSLGALMAQTLTMTRPSQRQRVVTAPDG